MWVDNKGMRWNKCLLYVMLFNCWTSWICRTSICCLLVIVCRWQKKPALYPKIKRLNNTVIRIWELLLWICVVVAFRHGQLRDPCSVSVGTWGTQDSKSKCLLISLSVSMELKRHDGKESCLKADVCFVPRMPTCWLNNSLGLRIRLQIKFWLCLVLRQQKKQNSVCLRKNLIS